MKKRNVNKAKDSESSLADGVTEALPPDGDGDVGEERAKKKKLPFRSIKVLTVFSLFIYALVILVLLWSLFFIFLFGIYEPMQARELSHVGVDATAVFPDRIDDKSMELYKLRMKDYARRENVGVVVFTGDAADDYDMLFSIDTLGNSTSEVTELFTEVLGAIDFNELFNVDGNVLKVKSDLGTFLCYGSINTVSPNNDAVGIVDARTVNKVFLLLIKPYHLLDSQTNIIIYVLALCSVVVVALAAVVAIIMSRYQTRNIVEISGKAKKLADGDYGVVFSGGGCVEYEILASALNSAKDAIVSTEELQRDVIANVSHDIRTPLTMIRAYAEMLRDMPLDEKKRAKTVGVIIDEADRLNVLADDFLNLSRLQSGVVDFEYERVNLSKLARAVVAQFDIFAERDGIKFECDIEENVYAECDAARIKQVLYNLIGNAVNYRGDDNVVTVSVRSDGGGAAVEVGDHGKGIPPEEVDSVWEKYYRATQTKRTTVGSGLGLTICKNILDAHGAEYGVRSEVGKGTVFMFKLGSAEERGGGTD